VVVSSSIRINYAFSNVPILLLDSLQAAPIARRPLPCRFDRYPVIAARADARFLSASASHFGNSAADERSPTFGNRAFCGGPHARTFGLLAARWSNRFGKNIARPVPRFAAVGDLQLAQHRCHARSAKFFRPRSGIDLGIDPSPAAIPSPAFPDSPQHLRCLLIARVLMLTIFFVAGTVGGVLIHKTARIDREASEHVTPWPSAATGNGDPL